MSARRFLLFAPLLVLLGLAVFFSSTGKARVAEGGCSPVSFTGEFDPLATTAIYDGKEIAVPKIKKAIAKSPVLGVATPNDRWIEVDLSEQKVKAWDGSSLYLESPVSTGLPWTPTPTGEFYIWVKLRATRMSGGSGAYAYSLPNVPFVMFFENGNIPGWKGYSLHGTYWHNDFGRVHSHGCVNLPTPIAEKLYYWVGPILSDGKNSTFSSPSNPGTKIIIHD